MIDFTRFRITDYITVSKIGSEDFEVAVNGYIKDGWIPLGGVACSGTEEDPVLTQAMVLIEEK